MFERLVLASIHSRGAILALLVMLIGAGGFAAYQLPLDAMPDVTSVQVSVLTRTGGLSAVEGESAVTMPIENALNGIPGMDELRSVTDSSVSSVTVVFKDGTDPWFARQLVLERLRGIERDLPPSAGTPELAPLSTGLGEIYQFVLRSPHHSPMQLRTLLDWEVLPRLRGVPGVTEVNTQGGELKQFQVHARRERLAAHGITLNQLVAALRGANQNVGGGYLERGDESFVVRGVGMLRDEEDIARVVVRGDADGAPVLVRQVADIQVAPALRYGVITYNGVGEATSGTVMMLFGSNSHRVVRDVAARVEEIRRDLPPGVTLETVYDRADFVGRTLSTVMTNLAEGSLIVLLVLALFLGTLRGALAVVIGIPASMSIAVLGMHAFGVTGDLMSLGAIDFGFLVDGPIVILEAVIGATAGRKLVGAARAGEYGEVASTTTRPVALAVTIIMLVYVPLLSLSGVEGKMFRPMALTMATALFGALVYAVLFFPAVLVTLVPPQKDHGPHWIERLADLYAGLVPWAIRRRLLLLGAASVLLVLIGWRFLATGAEFVPRIFEGDAVVTIRRPPTISLSKALELDLATERVLHRFPEVLSTLAMTGRGEVAVDVVGNNHTDILTRLRPLPEWTSAKDFDALSALFKDAIEAEVPGTFVSVSQPIEDRTNEIISGSRADVAIQIYGDDLNVLASKVAEVRRIVLDIPGTGDVRAERILGQPVLSAVANRARMATYGVRLEDAFSVLQSTREGIDVGRIYDGPRRFDLRVLQPPATATPEALGDLMVESELGSPVRLRDVLTITEGEGPVSVRRINRTRFGRVDVNLRGRDLLSWVQEAQARIGKEVPLDFGYRIEWGGQFENFARASQRLRIVLPIVVAIIFGMLLITFRKVGMAAAVFLTVPLSLTGGMLGLWLREMPFSLSAAVGFIALGGVAVLNGVVMGQQVLRYVGTGLPVADAVARASASVLRAILTTTAVAAFGFLPMALSRGAGAEAQRPLATAVVVGITVGAVMTTLVLPGVFVMILGRGRRPATARPS